MHEMLLMLASLMPIEDVINRLDEAIQKYKTDPSKENLREVEFNAVLLMSKANVSSNGEGVDAVMKSVEQMMRAKKGFDLLDIKQG